MKTMLLMTHLLPQVWRRQTKVHGQFVECDKLGCARKEGVVNG